MQISLARSFAAPLLDVCAQRGSVLDYIWGAGTGGLGEGRLDDFGRASMKAARCGVFMCASNAPSFVHAS
jgi:hypothetical protein